jgi:glycosyltransferase involved in cell wall biosynthesis
MHLIFVFLFIRKVIVHSRSIRDQLPPFLRGRAHVLPHVNYRLWGKDLATPRGTGPFRVLFFGRVLPYKGLEYLLQAFQQLDPNRFELVVAGEGDVSGYALDRPNVRTINRFITDQEMPALFLEAHAVVLPYVAASQSGVAYMAFAFGRPVIATRVGALAEVIADGDTGYLVEPCDGAALASALERLADTATWEHMSEEVRRQNLSADEDIRERLLEVYRA